MQPGVVAGSDVNNGGFETGSVGVPPASWAVQTFLNTAGFTPQTPQTYAGLNLQQGGKGATTIQNAATAQQSQPDPDLGPTASLRWPRYQNPDAMVNFHSSSVYSLSQNVNSLSQKFTLGPAAIDPSSAITSPRMKQRACSRRRIFLRFRA
jgi:hypothetical protein